MKRSQSTLRRAVERISTELNRESLLQTFLYEAVQEVGATAGGVMLRVPGTKNSFEMQATYTDHFWSPEGGWC